MRVLPPINRALAEADALCELIEAAKAWRRECGGHCNDRITKGGEVMGDVTELDQRRRKVPDRLQVARQKLIDVLDELRVGTLTKQQADAIQAAIEEELKVLRRDAGL